MHYIAVAPLAVSRRDTYTYRADSPLPPGTLVIVPYAGRERTGVVVDAADPDARAQPVISSGEKLPDWQLRFAQELATLYLAPLGQTFGLFLPKWHERLAPEVNQSSEPRIVLDTTLRLPEKPRSGQTLILVPERALLRQYADSGIVTFAAGRPIAEQRDIWMNVRNGNARQVVGTRSALFLPWKNLSEVVILHEDELGHQNDRTPRFHAREAARLLARAHGATLVLSSPASSLRAWDLAGRPAVESVPVPVPTVIVPRYDDFDDALPHGLLEKLVEIKGSILLHTIQGKVPTVRAAIKAAGLKQVTVGGQSAALAGKQYGTVVTIGIDAILSRPGYLVTERAVALLRKLGGLVDTDGSFIVYSKHGDHPAFAALGKPYDGFLKAEMLDRDSLSLPPCKPVVRVVAKESERPKLERDLEKLSIPAAAVRYNTEHGKLTALIKADPAKLRSLITPERRISVEY